MLASRGFASLALAYFKYEDLPTSFRKLDIEYFEEAVNYLLTVPNVIPDGCGVIGTCLGGVFAIALGVYVEKVRAIITINTAAIASGIQITYQGKVVIQGSKMTSEHMTFDDKFRVTPRKELWQSMMVPEHPNILPIDQIPADKSVLIIAGDDDSMLGHLSAQMFETKYKQSGKSNIRKIIYKGAGHMIEPPYGPLIEHAYQVDSNPAGKDPSKYVMYWGGKSNYMCTAQENSWAIIQDFIRSNISNKWSFNNLSPDNKISSKL